MFVDALPARTLALVARRRAPNRHDGARGAASAGGRGRRTGRRPAPGGDDGARLVTGPEGLRRRNTVLHFYWHGEIKKNIYVHRLAVDPKYQGKGYGIKLMDFIEENALKKGYKSIRLDTFSKNKRNINFYKKRGYLKIEDIYFPNQSIYPFYCLEKIL